MNTDQEQTSASEAVSEVPYYQTSQSDEKGWGQPPASYYSFFVIDNVMHGQLTAGAYVHSGHFVGGPPPDMELDAEMLAWDKAADESLKGFESQLK